MAEVLFLPGVNNDASVFDPVIAALPQGLEGRAVDLPVLDDVDAIATSLAGEVRDRQAIVGHSFGAVVAAALALQNPDAVAALILVNSPLRADTPERAAFRMERIEKVTTDEQYLTTAMNAVPKVYHPDNVENPRLLEEREASARRYGLERFVAHSKALAHRPDRTEALANASFPRLVVAADGDQVIATSAQREWAVEVGAAYEEVPHTGHMLPAEEPELLAEIIARFLANKQD